MIMSDVRSPERSSAAGPSLVEALERPATRFCRSPVSPTRCSSIGGVHVYTFNELEKTEIWRRQLVDRLKNQEETPCHK
jgi:hypothetical protein